jgi:hypothetical protein
VTPGYLPLDAYILTVWKVRTACRDCLDPRYVYTCAGHVHAMSSTRHGTSLVLLKPNRAERADNQNKSTHMVLNITYLIAFFAWDEAHSTDGQHSIGSIVDPSHACMHHGSFTQDCLSEGPKGSRDVTPQAIYESN